MNKTKYWIWLTLVFGIGSRRVWQIMSMFETAEKAFFALKRGAGGLNLSQREMRIIKNTDLSNAEYIINVCEKNNIGICAYDSKTYPLQLKNIYVPPAVLYYRGNIHCVLGTPTVTVVGTRSASEYSIRTTERICRELAANGVIIVSGFAVGTDITANMAAVNIGRPTVCVMGCGVDVNYPRENFGYRREILENGGVFISEYPPGTPARSSNFPRRNRILSALGRIAVIFQAAERSGSLITAGFAAEQGREVFTLPPADIMNPAYKGNSDLIRDGASVLLGAESILECFESNAPLHDEINSESENILKRNGTDLFEEGIASVAGADSDDRLMKLSSYMENKRELYSETADEISVIDNEANLNDIQRNIVEILKAGDADIDEIALQMDIDASEIATELTEMEMTGAVKALPGKRFSIGRT